MRRTRSSVSYTISMPIYIAIHTGQMLVLTECVYMSVQNVGRPPPRTIAKLCYIAARKILKFTMRAKSYPHL